MSEPTKVKESARHMRWADQYDFDKSDPATRLFVAASNWVDRCETAEAKRDEFGNEVIRLRERIAFIERFADAPDIKTGKTTRDHLRERVAALTDALQWILQADRGSRAFESALATARVILETKSPK